MIVLTSNSQRQLRHGLDGDLLTAPVRLLAGRREPTDRQRVLLADLISHFTCSQQNKISQWRLVRLR